MLLLILNRQFFGAIFFGKSRKVIITNTITVFMTGVKGWVLNSLLQ